MRLRNGLLGSVLVLMLLLVGLLQTLANAQTFKVLHDFFGGIDGSNPQSHLIRDSAGNLYGTTVNSASGGYGTVFKLDPSTNSLKTLHQFSYSDGIYPYGGLVLDANGILYGTTYMGGMNSYYGTIFKMDTSGGQFQTLYSFSVTDGAYPESGLLLDGQGHLFGTAFGGGGNSVGTVFRIDASGANFQVLHSFDQNADNAYYPDGGLVLDTNGILYGTTQNSSSSANYGAIYAVDTAGNNFRILHQFTSTDGANPYSTLALDGQGHLYGVASSGGNGGGAGVVFAIDTSGNNFSILHDFNDGSGAQPYQGLLLDTNGNLYVTTWEGGNIGYGEIFTLTTAGTNFQILHSFAGTDGANPFSYDVGLLLDDQGILYGTTSTGYSGGAYTSGVIYSLSPGNPPPLTATYFTVANVVGAVGQTVTLNGVLRHASDNTPLPNKTVQVFVGAVGAPYIGNPHVGNASTAAAGIAIFSYKIPDDFVAGTQPIAFGRFANSQYDASQGSATLTVMPSDTYVKVADVTGAPGQFVTLKATLYRSSDNTPLPNKTILVFVNGVHLGASATDSTGTARFSYLIPTTASAGTQPIGFNRFATNQYNASKGRGTLTIMP